MGHNETPLQREILAWLKTLDGACFARTQVYRGRVRSGRYMHTGEPGWGDITGAWLRVPAMIETKAEMGQSKEQIEMQQKWEAAGGIYILGTSLDQVQTELMWACGYNNFGI